LTETRARWTTLIVGSLFSLLLTLRIAMRAFALGSSEGGWVHPYVYAFQPRALVLFVIVCACCGVITLVSFSAVRRHDWRLVVVWLVAGILAQGVLRGLTPHSMEALFLGDGSNGFYEPTLHHRGIDLLRDFDRLRATLPEHPRTNMPGKLMLVYALEVVTLRPDVLGWLVVALSNAGGVFLYLFVRDFLDDRAAALAALVLYLFVPARLLFFPVLNTVTPVLVLASAWLWLRALQTRSLAYASALGASAYAMVFFEPTPAVMGLTFVWLTTYAVWRGDVDLRTVLRLTGAVIAAFAVTYIVMRLVFHFDLVATLRAVAADAVEFNARVSRPYRIWLVENLIDLAFAAGFCQAIVFAWCVARAFGRDGLLRGGKTGRLAALSVGIALALVATDLAGINRGEVVRLWIFFACFVQVPAAYVCARLESRGALTLVLAVTLLQDGVSASMMAFAQP
jgi:hypothetical protein